MVVSSGIPWCRNILFKFERREMIKRCVRKTIPSEPREKIIFLIIVQNLLVYELVYFIQNVKYHVKIFMTFSYASSNNCTHY